MPKSRWFAWLLLVCFADALAADIGGVGIRKLQVVDPLDQRPMDVVAFFPSPEAASVMGVGPYRVAASKTAPIGSGRYPVVLLSHGTMGSQLGHHDLASALAAQGFVVISMTHPGDNFQDASRVGAVSALYGRPMQVSAALTAALDDPILASHLEPRQIGFVGFSAGGTAGLVEAGAKPEPSRLVSYCAKRADDRHVCADGGVLKLDRPELVARSDQRIRAFVLLAPQSVVFPEDQLKQIKAPVLIYVGAQDEELSPAENGIALAKAIPSARLEVIPAASHFAFLAPCSEALARESPELCSDPPGMDRTALHAKLDVEIAGFFKEVLKVPQS